LKCAKIITEIKLQKSTRQEEIKAMKIYIAMVSYTDLEDQKERRFVEYCGISKEKAQEKLQEFKKYNDAIKDLHAYLQVWKNGRQVEVITV
jgi:2-phosphoglycerate kinase